MAGPRTTNNGQIQARKSDPADKLVRLLDSMKSEIARALPRHLTPDRMARVALTALRTVPGLLECSPASFAACVMTLSQIGLEPSTPLQHAYLIPRRIKGRPECTLIIGYQGLIELARRSGQLRAIWAYPAYAGDRFTVCYGLSPSIHHEPSFDVERNEKTLTHVYAAAKLKDTDDPVFVVLTKKEIDGYRARGGSRSFSPWDTDYEAMALKTAVRRLYRWLPKSIEVATALRVDEAPEINRSALDVIGADVRDSLARQGLDAGAEAPALEANGQEERLDEGTGEVLPADTDPFYAEEPEKEPVS